MLLRTSIFLPPGWPVLALLLAGAAGAFAGPTNPPAGKTNVPTAIGTNPTPTEIPISPSVFVSPGPGNSGKDPFFPKSIRLPGANVNPTNPPVKVAAELSLNGISGTPARPLAIINSRTFSAGEEGEVPTSSGTRVRILCVEIRFEQETVVVEVDGARRELKFRGRK